MSKKLILYLSLFTLIILGICFLTFYSLGKSKGKEDCLKEKVETKIETIEVIRYINSKDSEIYSRPSSNFESILQRMERNEL